MTTRPDGRWTPPDEESEVRCGWADAMGSFEDIEDEASLLNEAEPGWTDADLDALLALAGVER